MARMNPRSAVRVRDGRVQTKNAPGRLQAFSLHDVRLERRRPADGHRHLVTVAHLRAFLPLLPDWDEAAVGLRAIVLDSDTDCYGWYQGGVVALCNWEHDLWTLESPGFLAEFATLLDLLGVERVTAQESSFLRDINDTIRGANENVEGAQLQPVTVPNATWQEVRWTEAQARAFLLLHTLPHELGHHHDAMTPRNPGEPHRGEPYAEAYARRALDALWEPYTRQFGL